MRLVLLSAVAASAAAGVQEDRLRRDAVDRAAQRLALRGARLAGDFARPAAASDGGPDEAPPTAALPSTDRVAVFGACDAGYVERYWAAFASLGCAGADAYLLVDDAAPAAMAALRRRTPPRLRLHYVAARWAPALDAPALDTRWPYMAYAWAAGPQIFHEAGYVHALYVDGDVFATPAFDCAGLARRLAPMLDAGPATAAAAVVAVGESSLFTMVAALGATDADELTRLGGVVGLALPALVGDSRLIANTGVLFFGCGRAAAAEFFERFLDALWLTAQVVSVRGDMHVFGVMTLADAGLASFGLPLALNFRFDKSVAALTVLPTGQVHFEYLPAPVVLTAEDVEIAHFNWCKPWDSPEKWAASPDCADAVRRNLADQWRAANATLFAEAEADLLKGARPLRTAQEGPLFRR
ncbi:hypothetical protein M885DRAFT_589323 [Pelagophyceae sp. CCMP2097]|nr:hypothetical protein M885DRAFT_589323 [Pelagophyceae sp. CCMP2097]